MNINLTSINLKIEDHQFESLQKFASDELPHELTNPIELKIYGTGIDRINLDFVLSRPSPIENIIRNVARKIEKKLKLNKDKYESIYIEGIEFQYKDIKKFRLIFHHPKNSNQLRTAREIAIQYGKHTQDLKCDFVGVSYIEPFTDMTFLDEHLSNDSEEIAYYLSLQLAKHLTDRHYNFSTTARLYRESGENLNSTIADCPQKTAHALRIGYNYAIGNRNSVNNSRYSTTCFYLHGYIKTRHNSHPNSKRRRKNANSLLPISEHRARMEVGIAGEKTQEFIDKDTLTIKSSGIQKFFHSKQELVISNERISKAWRNQRRNWQ